MRSSLLLAVAVALVAAACGAPDSGTALAGGASTPATSPATSATNSPAAGAAAPTTVDDRPVAPDFTLALGNGGTFTLSEEQRPVYMVFWAEW